MCMHKAHAGSSCKRSHAGRQESSSLPPILLQVHGDFSTFCRPNPVFFSLLLVVFICNGLTVSYHDERRFGISFPPVALTDLAVYISTTAIRSDDSTGLSLSPSSPAGPSYRGLVEREKAREKRLVRVACVSRFHDGSWRY